MPLWVLVETMLVFYAKRKMKMGNIGFIPQYPIDTVSDIGVRVLNSNHNGQCERKKERCPNPLLYMDNIKAAK